MAWTYDAQQGPDADLWRILEEEERLRAVVEHHRQLKGAHARLESIQAHAAMHVAVENQLADDQPLAVRVTMRRLVDGGLNRHEAVHAVGAVTARHLLAILQKKGTWDEAAYIRDLNALAAESAMSSVRDKH
ncbi:MAG: DUF1841 family protein [Deltaproteobacteria bacterium]|nr:DUF1841 family protein [Deltaproteobacteria bacterium]